MNISCIKRFFRLGFLITPLLTHAEPTVLMLYDSPNSQLSRLFLGNLLGHFNKEYTTQPISLFNKTLAEQYETIFYFGSEYNAPLPPAFIEFALDSSQTLVWFKYNLWQLHTPTASLEARYGFHFLALDHNGLNQVTYKETQLTRNLLDKEIGVVRITQPEKVQVLATAEKAGTQEHTPYIIRSDNFWYVGDIPFAYIDEDDRYLAFADVLYDILKVDIKPRKRAFVRLEDIAPHYNTALLKSFSDYLYAEHIPFGISLIPYFKDPFNIFSNLPLDLPLTAVPAFVDTLKGMLAHGGELILHGYTHQYDALRNPYLGISGADYEFMRVHIDPKTFETTQIHTLPEDSPEWVAQRVFLAETLLKQNALHASYWETPHYTASEIDHQFFAQHFQANIGRIEYYDEQSHSQNQFFPYVIYKDHYGQMIMPENLGCYSPSAWYNHPKRNISDMLNSAKKNLVVRDAWASFYYHPYLGVEPLKELIQGLQALGYEFVSIESTIH